MEMREIFLWSSVAFIAISFFVSLGVIYYSHFVKFKDRSHEIDKMFFRKLALENSLKNKRNPEIGKTVKIRHIERYENKNVCD